MRFTAALVMGLLSGFLIYMSLSMMLNESGRFPLALVLPTLLGGWALSTWLLLRGTRTLTRVLSRGFLVGAAEWLLIGLGAVVMGGGALGKSIQGSPASDPATTGTIIGGGLAIGLMGGLSVAMALVCLIGFAIAHFMGREMKKESAVPGKKCPECAEMIQAEAKRCRFCGASFADPVGVPCWLVMVTLATTWVGCLVPSAGHAEKLFDCAYENSPEGGRVVSIAFYAKLPPPATVDRILRESLEHAVLVDASENILASAFRVEEQLTRNQYSGDLIYKASAHRILTWDEYKGVKAVTSQREKYFVRVEQDRTAEGITPIHRWLELELVFTQQPTQEAAYEALIEEISKLASRGLDVSGYVSIGDPKVKTSWKQMRDKNGGYIFGDYYATTKAISRKNRTLRQL